MKCHQFKANLRSGKRVYGTLVISNSPHWVPIMGRIGLDFVFIDTEHIALDRHTLAWMCQAYAAKGLPPVVRIPRPDPFDASMVLDGGAAGVIAPYVETASQVRDLVGAVKFKPLKGDRLKKVLADLDSPEPSLREYLDQANADRILVVNIESTPAIENLDSILDVVGLDAILIGPHDLSCSLGIPEQYENQNFIEAVDEIIERTSARGIGVGIHVISDSLAQNEVRWAKRGANLIVHSADIIAVSDKLHADIGQMRKELGDSREPSGNQDINI